MPRADGRNLDALRPVTITAAVNRWAEGSCQVEFGDTIVMCTASVEEQVPRFRRETGMGWLTAEYDMLPRSTSERRNRSGAGSRPDSRSLEISRLIGRSLRSVMDFGKLGQRTITLDCDVLQADGGTRTAAITGAWVALMDAIEYLIGIKAIKSSPVKDSVAAISVGVVGNEELLDLCYLEDSKAAVDFNVVMTGSMRMIELQGTGEERPFSRDQLNRLLDLAEKGIVELCKVQKATLAAEAE